MHLKTKGYYRDKKETMMHIFEKSSHINCTVEELFDFHLDTKNLKKITPPNIKVTQLSNNFTPKVGEVLELRTVKYGLPTTWKVRIEVLERPNLLVDKAIKSPFSFWEHQHIFHQKDGFCELKDVVKFSLPFSFIGKLLAPLIKKDLQKMFEYRHKVTKEILQR